METTIPFAGFYNSIHDQELDSALDSIFSDSRGNPISSLKDKAFDLVDWRACHLAYAEKYAECFADEFNVHSLKFKLLCSPREYNFETDRIICSISLEEVTRMYMGIDKDIFKSHIKARFTSCSGFISHYPNDVALWPIELSEWDHNQIGTLIEAYVIKQHGSLLGQYEEYTLMGDTYEHAYNIVASNHNGADRLYKIRDYLVQREERKWKHV